MNIQTVKNVSDCEPLYLPHSLYLKPHARIGISVQMPPTTTGKAISNWDVMENLRNIISPDKFSVLKATKSTLELIRFDAELDDREHLKSVVSRLDGNSIKLSGFTENAKIRASEAKDDFPKRHDWDSYFRDARNMDEKKPGERPDTIHISNLPIRWFCPRHMENEDSVKPSENIFKRIFEKFGSVRAVDIPICDAYRKHMKSHMTGMKTFSFDQELYFEGYVQFSEYMGFVRTMDALRGMKLLHKEGDKNLAIHIAVNFDTSKHLSESNIKRRAIVRDRLIVKESEQQEEERRKAEEEELKKEKERQKVEQVKLEAYEKQRQREEKRKQKHLKKIREQEQLQLSSKIRSEEKKLLIAQRKLESIRILEALFERIKVKNETLRAKIKKEKSETKTKDKSEPASIDLRNKLIKKVKTEQEKEWERQKHRVKKYKSNESKNQQDGEHERSPSVNSISSDESILSDRSPKKKERKTSVSYASEEDHHNGEGNPISLLPTMPGYPMYNPETGQFMGMYPYPAPFFPTPMCPTNMPYMNNFRGGGYRGRFPRRGRGTYRGRHSSNSYDDRVGSSYNKRRRDYGRRSNSRSRSRNRSRSRSRSRSRGRNSRSYSSRSRSRSYSRSRRNPRSRSKSRTKLQEDHRSRKLASTLRRSDSSSSSSSRSSRSRSQKSATKDQRRSRSRERTETKRDRSKSRRGDKRRSSRSRSHNKRPSDGDKNHTPNATPPPPHSASPKRSSKSRSKSRAKSVDSSSFQSPKRKQLSATPEKEWN